jgi:iron complex outermembrane receptor protein
MRYSRQFVRCGMLATLLAANRAVAQTPENKAEVFELPTVNVVATTPLPGLGVPLEDVPANVQIIKGAAISDQHEINLTGFLEHNVNNVNINSEQGNADQQSVMFRGFYASPILGVAQGISVFQDGVRINESFGDVVNWDLLPATAISSMQLIPGSNPLFGLNTLGGALAINTKSGKEYPGFSMSLSAGSFNRKQVAVEYGGANGNWDYFFTANDSNTQGYATQNLSHVRQFFGKVGWSDEKTDIDLSLTLADNYLGGNQTLPVAMLNNLRQAYTYPDTNHNELVFLTLKGTHFLADTLLLGGTAYFRDSDNFGVNSNTNGGPYNTPTCATDPGPPDANGNPTPANGENCSGSNVFQHLIQNTYGGGLQLTSTEKWLGMNNQLIAGFTADLSNGGFNQGAQDAYFDASRNTLGVDAVSQNVLLKTATRYYGAFVSDSLQLSPRWTLTGSARYNADQVLMFDQLGSALNGNHSFNHFDPALGVNYKPKSDVVVYAGYSQGMRVPSPIELSCANPQAPCSLPNAFSSDPDLKMVTTQTWEIGSRFKIGAQTHVQLAAYQTQSQNDINFVTDTASPTQGYFANVGTTRRRGLEFSSQTVFPLWNLLTAYSYNQAVYQSSFALISPNNVSADANGIIQVAPGDRIPNVPSQSLKLRLEFTPNPRWRVGVNMNAYGNMYSRGDENNQDPAGRIAGYAVFNLDATVELSKEWEAFLLGNNLFDRHYANFGVLGTNFFTAPGNTYNVNGVPSQFVGVGQPLGVWAGLRYRFK